MVQGHTLDVLLAPQYRDGAFFNFWLYLRGLTAPMFLVLAGCSFTLVTMRRSDQNFGGGIPLRRLWRFASFIFLGYLMRMPARSFSDLKYADASALLGWAQVDVLQCIGLTLIGLQLLVHFAGNPRRFTMIATSLGAAIALATPFVWAVDWTRYIPAVFAGYLNGSIGSLFPLFPWAGFVLMGTALGYTYSVRGPEASIRIVAFTGLALAITGTALQFVPFSLVHGVDFWKTSPNFFLARYGGICLLLAGITYASRWFSPPEFATKTIARESLVAYLAHIAILYGTSWTLGLRQTMGPTLSPFHVIAAILLLMLATVAVAIGWNYTKRTVPVLGRQLIYAATSLRAES